MNIESSFMGRTRSTQVIGKESLIETKYQKYLR
jgi:hypothetical protein